MWRATADTRIEKTCVPNSPGQITKIEVYRGHPGGVMPGGRVEGPPDAGSALPHIDYGPDLENGGFSTRCQFHTHLIGPAGADWTEPATGARGVRPGRTAPGEDRIRSGSGVKALPEVSVAATRRLSGWHHGSTRASASWRGCPILPGRQNQRPPCTRRSR